MRKIIHIDADAFYASVEERDDPSLKTYPIAVGGDPNGRGVVATCNYLARSYGVRSAMPSGQALKLCPQLRFIRPRFSAYKDASRQMHDIFKRFTEKIEPLSLDEAYLDVSDSPLCQGSATRIAQEVQKAIELEVQLTVSAGVAPNKFLAKVASDWRKPAGLFVISPEQVGSFVRTLPVEKINGVGKVTAQRLHEMGIKTCEDLQTVDAHALEQRFGKYGVRLSQLAYGNDTREVTSQRQRKSLSVEHTLETNINTETALADKSKTLFEELLTRANNLKPDQSITARVVKLKFDDFSQTTLEEGIVIGLEDWRKPEHFQTMLIQAWQRKARPVRLVGLGLRIGNTKNDANQLDLFDTSSEHVASDTAANHTSTP